jgi:type VI secretion system secreted protein VgrG
MNSEVLHLTVRLDSPMGSLEPYHARVAEGLSELTDAAVELSLGVDDDPTGLLDEDVQLTWSRGGLPLRTHALRVAEVQYLGARHGHPRFRLLLRPPLWFLRFTRDVRKFRDQTAQDIVTKVLDDAGIAHRWEIARTPAARPYTVQYRESKLDFVLRLLEMEGIFYLFEDDGTLVLRDRSSASPAVPGAALYTLLEGAGALDHGAEGITSFSKGTRVGSGCSTVNDHDWKKPATSLLATKPGKRDVALEVYEYPVGYRDKAAGEVLAQIRVESFEATKIFAAGTSTVLGFGAGRAFTFEHEDGVSHSGEYALRRVEHVWTWNQAGLDAGLAAGAGATGAKYENTFEAIPLAVPFRAPIVTPQPRIGGTHTAMVRGPTGEEIHTDTWGRAKVQFHWDREATGTDLDSRWMRVLQETSSSMQVARVGWEVSVGYVAGDPDRPLVLSRNINGQMIPSYAQPRNQNMMTIKTETYPGKVGYNELRLDDSATTQQVYMQAERNLVSDVKHDQRETIGRHEKHDVTTHIQRKVDKDQTLSVGASETVKIGSADRFAVGENRTVTIGGSDEIKIGESSTLQVSGNDIETVGAVRISIVGGITPPKVSDLLPKPDVKAGAQAAAAGLAKGGGMGAVTAQAKAMVPTPQSITSKLSSPAALLEMVDGNISRTVRKTFQRTVGGAYIALAGGPVAHRGNKVLAELIGGLKVATAANNSLSQTAKKILLRTVGGMHLIKAGTDVTINAEKSSVVVGGAASFTAVEKIDLKGERLLVETRTKLTLKSGGLLIELAPGGITLAGKVALKAADEIQINGKPDNLTR